MTRFFLAAAIFSACTGVHAQVVQLPSYHNFSISTSVSVPDGGTMSLGGLGSGASSSTSRGWGPYSSRTGGSRAGGGSISLSAQIIDLQALDEAILGQDLSNNSAPSTSGIQPANPIGATVNGSRPSAKLAGDPAHQFFNSTSRIQVPRPVQQPGGWQRAAGGVRESQRPSTDEESDIRYYLERAKQAEDLGRIESARVYYRMALQAMTPQMIARYQQVVARRADEAQTAAASDAKAKTSAPRSRF
ncbi:MAG: hypothetical protein R3C53_21260 [Pirellulaceae bacterium]